MALKYWYDATNVRSGRTAGSQTRVCLFGDSLAAQTYGIAANHDALFADQMNQLGYNTALQGIGGTGLLDFHSGGSGEFAGPLHLWCDNVNNLVNGYDPDFIIVWYRGNYRVGGDPGQPGINPGTPTFYSTWQSEAIHFTQVATRRGAQVVWVIGPSMLDSTLDAQTRGVGATYNQTIEQVPGTGTVNAYRWLADPWALNDCHGVQMRDPDGVHLSPGGCNLMASVMLDRIVPSWKVAIP